MTSECSSELLIDKISSWSDNILFALQEPTDSLEETLLMSQPDFSLGAENGNEEDDNSGLHADNPINHSLDNACAFQCFQVTNRHVSAKIFIDYLICFQIDLES